jgi:hypothetical protein
MSAWPDTDSGQPEGQIVGRKFVVARGDPRLDRGRLANAALPLTQSYAKVPDCSRPA